MAALDAGTIVGGYEVHASIAVGTSAEVFRARDLRTDATHALKIALRPDTSWKLLREFELLNLLNHPGVARAYRCGQHGDKAWVGVELLRGPTAPKYATSLGAAAEPARIRALLAAAALAARGLQYLHERGLVHRDVKPDNLVVLPDQRVRWIGLGSAWSNGLDDPVVAAGGIVGTAGFAPPEVYKGADPDPTIDLYAFGATLYRVFTGKLPFKADSTRAMVDLQQAGSFADPGSLVPNLPKPLTAVIGQLLKPAPAQRLRTAREVADRMEALIGPAHLLGSSLAFYPDEGGMPGARSTTGLDLATTAARIGWRLGRRAPTGRIARQLFEATGGLPRAVDDVARGLAGTTRAKVEGNQVFWARTPLDLPVEASLEQAVRERVAACNDAQRQALQVIAVTGAIPLAVLGDLLPNPSTVGSVVKALATESLVIRDADDVCRPANDAVATYVRSLKGVADAVAAELEGDLDDLPATPWKVALQVKGGQVDTAVAELLPVATDLARRGRFQEVAALIEPLWPLRDKAPPSDDLARCFLLYARAGVAIGWRNANAALAVKAARRLGQGAALGLECQLVTAQLNRAIGHYAKYRTEIGAALELARVAQDPELKATVSLAMAEVHLWSGEPHLAAKHAAHTPDVSRGLQSRQLTVLARTATAQGNVTQGEAQARQALELADDDPVAIAGARVALAEALARQGKLSAALDALAEGLPATRHLEDPAPYASLLVAMGWCEVELNRLGPAQDCVDELVACVRPGELLRTRLEVSLLEGRVQLLSGDPYAAAVTLRKVDEAATSASLGHLAAEARAWLIDAEGGMAAGPQALDAWYQSRRLGFLASRDVWTYTNDCLRYLQHRKPAPADVVTALDKAVGTDPPPAVRIRVALARFDLALAARDANAGRSATKDAGAALEAFAAGLSDADHATMNVHPWTARVRAAIGALKGSKGPRGA